MPKNKKVPENQKFSYGDKQLLPANKSIMTKSRGFCGDKSDDDEEPRQKFSQKKKFQPSERPRNGQSMLYSTTMMAGPTAYVVTTTYKQTDRADNVVHWGDSVPPDLKRLISNCHMHPAFVVKQHAGMATSNRRLVITLQKNKAVEDNQIHGFIQIMSDSLMRFTDNCCLHPLTIMEEDGFSLFHHVGSKIEEMRLPGVSLAKSFFALKYPFDNDTELRMKKVASETVGGVRVAVDEGEEPPAKYGVVKAMPMSTVSRMAVPGQIVTNLTANRDIMSPGVVQRSVGVVMVDGQMNGQCSYVESATGMTYIVSANHVANIKAKTVAFFFPVDDVTVKESTFTYDEQADVYLQREKLSLPSLKVAEPIDNRTSNLVGFCHESSETFISQAVVFSSDKASVGKCWPGRSGSA